MKTLIEHVTVLTMDSEKRVFPDGYVLIEDTKILAVGGCGDLQISESGDGRCCLKPAERETDGVRYELDLKNGDCRIDGNGGILMSGMINVHSHIPMIPFRSMGDDCPDRLRRFLFPLELEAMTPELVYAASRYAICELLLSGVTSVLDMYYFEDQVARACDEMGIRGWVGETIINMETCDGKEPYSGLALCEELLKNWKGHDRIHPLVAPHATNTNSPEMLKAAYELAEKYDAYYTLHVSEMDYEMELFRETYHQTPIEFLYGLGVLGPKTIAAHCIHATERDIELFAETDTRVAHCIGANTKGGKGVCPVLDMRKAGVTVGIGTDGPSSGNTLDLFTQFKMIASFQKTKYHNRGAMPADEIVELGTMGGARVLGEERRIGSIESGKQADLVLVETESVNMFPIYNPYSAIVYSANASNVDSVWVAGKRLVAGHKLTHGSLADERKKLESVMKAFRSHAETYREML